MCGDSCSLLRILDRPRALNYVVTHGLIDEPLLLSAGVLIVVLRLVVIFSVIEKLDQRPGVQLLEGVSLLVFVVSALVSQHLPEDVLLALSLRRHLRLVQER